MKILFLNTGAELGGAERSLLDLIASLQAADPSIEFSLVTSAAGPLVERCEAVGVKTLVLPMPESLASLGDSQRRDGRLLRMLAMAPAGWNAWRYARQLSQVIRDVRPDVVHSNSIKYHLLTSLVPRAARTVVWHVRDFMGSRPIVAKALQFGTLANGIIAISRAVADDVVATVPKARVEVVHNAIDVEHFCPGPVDPHRLDELAGLPPAASGTIRVGLVATYAKWKGQDVFIDAAARLRGAAVRCYLVGGPIYQTHGSQWSRAELTARAAPLVSGGTFGFIDFQSDPRDIYRGLDIVVHASAKPEPFGRTIVEAMACGRAVVAAQAGGAAELFTEGHDAVGIVPNSAESLAAALTPLIESHEKREMLGSNARISAVEKFSRSRLGPQVLAAYERFRPSD